MNLKEAFQAQNKIGELMEYITCYLSDEDNVMTVTEKHLRSKALAGQPDDTVDVSCKGEEGFAVERLITIWQELMEEKERLGQAIGKAKAGMRFNLDAAVEGNKSRRAFLSMLQDLANCKSSHELQKGEGCGYVFNNDGNQTAYRYDIDRIMTIDYDRNKVRAIVKELNRTADEVSIKIDEALLQTPVDYTPKFDLAGESRFILEEMMER
ncbi:formate dehydrogenase [Selenomonas sp. TAMA-11512]|uniref:formate dehydrogenase n=1 Tax=Selenomonas sp. TAMA-11512 TaxID=3095337 RepID=UPI0030CF64BC